MIKCLCNLVIDVPERRLAVARLGRLTGGNPFGGNLFGGSPLALYQSYDACCECRQCQDYPFARVGCKRREPQTLHTVCLSAPIIGIEESVQTLQGRERSAQVFDEGFFYS